MIIIMSCINQGMYGITTFFSFRTPLYCRIIALLMNIKNLGYPFSSARHNIFWPSPVFFGDIPKMDINPYFNFFPLLTQRKEAKEKVPREKSFSALTARFSGISELASLNRLKFCSEKRLLDRRFSRGFSVLFFT